MPFYLNPVIAGITETIASNDGASISVRWATAYSRTSNKIAYNIYFSDTKDTLFEEGPKYFVTSASNQYKITDLTPGTIYYFAVRAVEYDENLFDFTNITSISGGYVFPTTLLSSNITETSTVVPVVDTSGYPSSGLLVVGVEVIGYDSLGVDQFILNSVSSRGLSGTIASLHQTDGYDGTLVRNPVVRLYFGNEEQNPRVYQAQCRFDIDEFAYRVTDGYRQITKDILTTDLSASDQFNEPFPSYDYAGWHRTNPAQLLSGECVGSYIGGEQYCADGYEGVGRVLRGMSVQEQNNQRQEMLLEVTGRVAVLLKKQRTGIVCSCVLASSEYPDDRCVKCFGTGRIVGWQQYFNPRRSDGRILIRPGAADEDLRSTEAGLESEISLDCWTLTVPTIKDRDILILFDQDDNEEFRYEVITVTRNATLQNLVGAQKFKMQRIRKTDPAYQISVFRNTAMLPIKTTTSVGSGPGLLPHVHTITINEKDPSEFGQITSVSAGHSHVVRFESGQLVVKEALGHTHTIII